MQNIVKDTLWYDIISNIVENNKIDAVEKKEKMKSHSIPRKSNLGGYCFL